MSDNKEVRDRIRAVISDAYYESRNQGGTMDQAADRAADDVVELLVDRGLLDSPNVQWGTRKGTGRW